MERPYTLDNLDHVVLRVHDLKKSTAFYAMLGGELEGEVAAGTLMRIPSGQSIILQERREYVPAAVGALDHINLMIQAANIHDVAAYLQATGAEIASVVDTGRVGPTVNVRDPDGHMLEIRIKRG